VHDLRRAQRRKDRGRDVRLWAWSAVTAWRKVKAVMDAAGITGSHATPKGLRHGFGVAAVQASIPLNLVQRWLGHAQLSTTAIYAEAMGKEERDIASRMWR
jgi:site-specific recombinase XerD